MISMFSFTTTQYENALFTFDHYEYHPFQECSSQSKCIWTGLSYTEIVRLFTIKTWTLMGGFFSHSRENSIMFFGISQLVSITMISAIIFRMESVRYGIAVGRIWALLFVWASYWIAVSFPLPLVLGCMICQEGKQRKLSVSSSSSSSSSSSTIQGSSIDIFVLAVFILFTLVTWAINLAVPATHWAYDLVINVGFVLLMALFAYGPRSGVEVVKGNGHMRHSNESQALALFIFTAGASAVLSGYFLTMLLLSDYSLSLSSIIQHTFATCSQNASLFTDFTLTTLVSTLFVCFDSSSTDANSRVGSPLSWTRILFTLVTLFSPGLGVGCYMVLRSSAFVSDENHNIPVTKRGEKKND